MDIVPNLLDVNDVARTLRVSPHTVRRWASVGKLRRLKLGTRTLFEAAELARFVEEARKQGPQSAEANHE